MTKVALLDYGVGDLYSVANALKVAGADVITTDRADDIKKQIKFCCQVWVLCVMQWHIWLNISIDIAVKSF